MSATFNFDGLQELVDGLRAMPDGLAADADHIVQAHANRAALAIKQGYPYRTGDLVTHVFVSQFDHGKVSTGWVVKNTSKLAYIFENGTQARHTQLGADRGSMPPGHVFVPPIVRERRAMYEDLKDLLVRYGLVVRGDA